MCGRFAQVFEDTDVSRIEEIIRAACQSDELLIPSFNTAPTEPAGIIAKPEPSGPPMTCRARFGLVPSWSDGPGSGPLMFNARSETLREKPSFRGLVRSRRCVVPISGFFEWQAVDGQRQKRPWYLSRADGDPMLVAGLWDTWCADGSELDSFAILTRAPDSFMEPIHDRMPVILEPDAAPDWIDGSLGDRQVDAMIAAQPAAGVLTGHRISRAISKAKGDDPSILDPIEAEDGEQGTLFG